jgi:hypothetical protein
VGTASCDHGCLCLVGRRRHWPSARSGGQQHFFGHAHPLWSLRRHLHVHGKGAPRQCSGPLRCAGPQCLRLHSAPVPDSHPPTMLVALALCHRRGPIAPLRSCTSPSTLVAPTPRREGVTPTIRTSPTWRASRMPPTTHHHARPPHSPSMPTALAPCLRRGHSAPPPRTRTLAS